MSSSSEIALASLARVLPKIRYIRSHRPPTFVGKQQARYGFGADCSPAFVDALYGALSGEDWSFPIPWNRQRQQATTNSQVAWSGSVTNLLQHIPVTAIRLQDTHYDVVSTYLHYLQPGTTPVVTIDHIVRDNGPLTELRGPDEPWRYANFANIVWYQLGPHLRTREMLDPNAVWRRLRELFDGYQSFIGRWANYSDGHRRRELACYFLAIYERTCALLWERHGQDPRYLRDVSQRELDPSGLEHILTLPTESVGDHNLAEARLVRTMAYEELLLYTFVNCRAALTCLR